MFQGLISTAVDNIKSLRYSIPIRNPRAALTPPPELNCRTCTDRRTGAPPQKARQKPDQTEDSAESSAPRPTMWTLDIGPIPSPSNCHQQKNSFEIQCEHKKSTKKLVHSLRGTGLEKQAIWRRHQPNFREKSWEISENSL